VSALTKIPVRHDLAMTGEVTLRGRVLPIGGLKEKVLAAHRGGIKTILIPSENEKDILDIPANVLKTVELVLVDHMDAVLRRALLLDNPEELFRKKAPPPVPEPIPSAFPPAAESTIDVVAH
jgi:ATP-dependent Lon protease